MIRACEWCGAEFRSKPSRVASGRGRYCSHACCNRARRARRLPPGSPRSRINGVVDRDSRWIARAALGRSLPAGSIVHHVNSNNQDNRPQNLVLLQDVREHTELHRKMRVRAAGGDPWMDRWCGTCQSTLPISAFGKCRFRGTLFFAGMCRSCHRQRRRRQRLAQRDREAIHANDSERIA